MSLGQRQQSLHAARFPCCSVCWVTQQQLKVTRLFLLRPQVQFCFGSQVKSATKTAVSWLCRILHDTHSSLLQFYCKDVHKWQNYSNTYQRIHLSAVSAPWPNYHVKACKGTETGNEQKFQYCQYCTPDNLQHSLSHKISWFIKIIYLIFVYYSDKHNEARKITPEDPCPLPFFHFLHSFLV